MNPDVSPHIERVSLAAIVPGDNPRKDFGDIHALAERIEAVGGQPINPIVVVADGNRYRIVDGERRYRAMLELAGEGGSTNVLVFENFAAALEAVAMLATDDKKRLTEDEEARGFQSMLVLGVDETDIAKATGRPRDVIRRASRVARDEAAAQASIDQMVAAAEFDDPADQAAVLGAAPDKWLTKAGGIRRRIQEARLREEFMDVAAEVGAEVLDRKPEGYDQIILAFRPEEITDAAEGREGERLVMWPCGWNACYWVLGCPAGEEEGDEETPEERERRELRERREHALQEFKDSLFEEVATSDVCPAMQEAAAGFRAIGSNSTRERVAARIMKIHADDLEEEWRQRRVDNVIGSEMSMYELAALMVDYNPYVNWYDFVCTLYPAAVKEGWWPCEDAEWLHEQALAARAEAEERERDDDEEGEE